ncbi:NmrA family protein [Xylariaceae sp. FL0016]|nr:NmrA family protein [Xylariaceae sp. FL0016]
MATYLITQSTGMQARWTIHHLLAAGGKVHAVVRDLQKVPPALQDDPRITLFEGDSTNEAAIYAAAQGCEGVYLNTFPSPPSPVAESVQARAVLSACKRAGVASVVAMTTFNTAEPALWSTGPGHDLVGAYYAAKASVEREVRAAGLGAYTILRPSFIHGDYLRPHARLNYPALATRGELAHALAPGVGMLHVDEHDIGAYAAAALLDPARFAGREIKLGNEVLTAGQVRDIMARVSGRAIQVRELGDGEAEEARKTASGIKFQLFANLRPPVAGVGEQVAAEFGIPFTSLETYFQREKARLLESLPPQ